MNHPRVPVREIIDKYGEVRAKAYLLQRYDNPAFISEFKFLFPNHLVSSSAPFHNEILSAIVQGGRQGYAAPRGFAKSTLINIVGLPWFALTGRYHFILLISDTYTQAKAHLGGLKQELETNKAIHWLYGDVVGNPWGEDRIVINGPDGPCMILARGAGMKIRGLKFLQWRPQLAVIDDLENSEMVYSPERRIKLARWLDYDLMPALAKPKNVILLGTILHYHALLKKIVDKEGVYQSWKTHLYKALENGESTWPEEYPTEYLVAIRDDPEHPDYEGSIVFSQERQNEPQDDKDRIIKLDWIKEYHFASYLRTMIGENDVVRLDNWIKKLKIFAGVDPAIGEKEMSDRFSAYVFGLDPDTGKEYQLDLIHGKYTIDEQVDKIVDLCKEWSVDILGIESNAYQAGLFQLVRTKLQKENVRTRIRKIITDKDKIRRARIHSVAFEGGFVQLRKDHPKFDTIKKEIEEFPFGNFDDAFDSLMLAREARQKPKGRVFRHKPKGF